LAKPFYSKRIISSKPKEFNIMAGTKPGGIAAAKTNKTKYGSDFYAKIGAIGGKRGHTGGFAANRELARLAGAKGGRISRRTKKTV
jgi:general stress protein YciG